MKTLVIITSLIGVFVLLTIGEWDGYRRGEHDAEARRTCGLR